MTGADAVLAVVDALDVLDVPYLVVGSFASNFYGVARSTQDADFVIACGVEETTRIAERLGPAFRLDPQVSFETVTMTTRQILKLPGSRFTVELFHLSDDAHDQERFQRRRRVVMLGRAVTLPTPEDVVITKLRWAGSGARGKDWDDVRNVIAVQGAGLDWNYVENWCDRHQTRTLLEEIRRSLPEI